MVYVVIFFSTTMYPLAQSDDGLSNGRMHRIWWESEIQPWT